MRYPMIFPMALALYGFVVGNACAQTDSAADRPTLNGTWQYRARGSSCADQYYFRSDGTLMIQSGHEVTENTYTLAEQPDKSGFYKFDIEVTQTNGKRDCQGNQTPVGRQSGSYLRFQANGDRLILCRQANLTACMGPLIRLKGRIGT
ncbi:MAG TPA: hypothetical protein VFM48_09180 [Aquabacterium sp.]|nr:hypothetical protein [Aquabacterium sp.]